MTLSEFIKECQRILEKEGDGEVKNRIWCVDSYHDFEPEIEKDEELNCYIIS